MKNKLLCLLFVFFLSPVITNAAVTKTLEVEFAFSDPGNPQQPLGYSLYKDGTRVCQTSEPSASRISCSLTTEPGTFNFSLTASYANGGESPPSANFPFTISSTTPPENGTSPQSWSLKYVDSEETARQDGAGINAIDGDPTTIWHTSWSQSSPSCPHEIQINLGATQVINGIRYLPRQDGGVNGTIANYAVYVSNDGANWGTAVAQGTFTKDTTEKEVLFPATNGQFLRLVALSEINGKAWTSMAELDILYTTPTQTPPAVVIPPTAVLSSSTSVGEAPLVVNFDGSSSTTSNPPIVKYTWAFGDGSQATGKTTSHSFTTAGTYYTSLTVEDSKGLTNSINTPIIVTSTAPANLKPTAVITTSNTGGDAPLTISFDGSKSTDTDGSIIQYGWNFGDGSTGSGKAAQHTFTTKGTYTASLQVTDDKGEMVTATTQITCNTTLPPSAFNIAVGEVSINQTWVKVLFENTFIQPIVVAGPPTSNEIEPVLVRIRNLDQKGFEVRLQEWAYQNGNHVAETFSYIVMEKGTFTLDNGTKVEAGTFTGSNKFQKISLQQQYNYTPVILSQIITENETDAVTGRILNASQTSFDYMLQEQEMNSTSHTSESVCYIAWEPGQGEFGNMVYEAGSTTNSITDAWKDITFQTTFPDLPFFIAGMQTTDSVDTAAVRTQNMSQTKTQIKIEEEKSKDSEVGHTSEVVGYLAVGAKTATTTPPDDGTLPQSWSLKYADSEETARQDGAAINAMDGDPTTIWHTSWSQSSPACPHEIQINLGATQAINGIRYLPRQDGGVNGTIANYEVYVSNDGINWGNAVAQGTFTKDTTEKEVLFPATNGKFLRLVALSEINGKAWTSMAELNILYTTPSDDVTSAQPWSLKYADSEETARQDGAAVNAFDDDPTTLWHTAWSTSAPSCPHEIQLNLGATQTINGIRYLPRQDGGVNGTIAKYEVYVSNDGINWGNAVAQGTFTKDTTEKEALFPATNGKFIRLVALSEINGNAWTSVAELNVMYN